jgi:SNF2 family DNA or RNA helicase
MGLSVCLASVSGIAAFRGAPAPAKEQQMSAVPVERIADVPSRLVRNAPVPQLAGRPDGAAGTAPPRDIGPLALGGADLAALAPYEGLLTRLAAGARVDPDRSWLADEAARIWSKPGFDTFLCLPHLRFEPFDYQRKAAQAALRRMRGRAILADEVGLGKTIEAGLVLSELRLRGVSDHSLVITPAGLVSQWQEELERKFGLPTVIADSAGWPADPVQRPVVLASIAAARRDPLQSLLTAGQWDLVVVDEAHRVRSPRSASGRLARALRARFLLLLTATPVENRLQDLYELVSLVSPGLLGTAAQFRDRHVSRDVAAGSAGSAPRNVAELRRATSDVMVRNRRSEVALALPQRLAETVIVQPGTSEAAWYADLTQRIREAGRDAGPARLMALRTLARLAGSSPAAAATTLTKIGWDDLAERARVLARPEKLALLARLVRAHAERREKVIVFTAFRETLDRIIGDARQAGVPAAVYHGSLTRREKENAISAFRDDVDVLLSTESAGEGRNIQFCHAMINVDLPWNPMQIEQRLGRLHRIGQQHEVTLTNLVAAGTIEQRILRLLESKINMFELVVGELDMILGRIDPDFDFETSVFDAFVASAHDEEFGRRLHELGDELAKARTSYLRSRAAVDDLVGAE